MNSVIISVTKNTKAKTDSIHARFLFLFLNAPLQFESGNFGACKHRSCEHSYFFVFFETVAQVAPNIVQHYIFPRFAVDKC